MGKQKGKRLAQVTKILNVGTHSIVEFLEKKGIIIEAKPNTKITMDQYALLEKEFAASIATKQEADELTIGVNRENLSGGSGVVQQKEQVEEAEEVIIVKSQLESPIVKDAPVLENIKSEKVEEKVVEEVAEADSVSEEVTIPEPVEEEEKDVDTKPKLQGLKVKGKVELDSKNRPVRKKSAEKSEEPTTQKKEEVNKEETPVAESKEKEEEKQDVIEETPVKQKEKEEVIIENKDTSPKEEEVKKEEVKEDVVKEEVVKKEEAKEVIAEEVHEEPIKEKPEIEKSEIIEPEVIKPKIKEEKPVQVNKKEDIIEEKELVTEKLEEKSEVVSNEETDSVDVVVNEENETQVVSSEENKEAKIIEAKADKLQGLKVLGKIELPSEKPKKVASSDDKKRQKRKRIKKVVKKPASQQSSGQQNKSNQGPSDQQNKKKKGQPVSSDNKKGSSSGNKRGNVSGNKRGNVKKEEVSQQDVHAQYKKTLARLSGGGNSSKKTFNKRQYRKDKRASIAAKREKLEGQEDTSILKVTEFISANELATLMEVGVNEIIAKCFAMGMVVSINQRLDAEAITFITDEFGFGVEFTTDEEEIEVVEEEEDATEDMLERAPIVTIMGHVDHGKTSLLDYIRSAKVAEGEAGGITQHIGAYDVTTDSGKRIAFLDTPGHEAFTAMRARGAKLTDVAIIVIAADDSVMPQTEEALNHAQVAGVPIVIAINKIDKPGANPDKIKEELSQRNILVEDWGGKYQCYEISAKKGTGIDDLLEGVLLEAEVLELKANPSKKASGTVVEATLDKGRGYVTTVLVQAGTMRVGDVILAGHHYGRVKAMTNHLGAKVKEAPPATPVQILGLNGAAQSGDRFNIMDAEKDAREVATKREQILREQKIRTTKRTTLSELGRRIALRNFVQLNLIIKGDVDGSVEALTGSLLKLTTQEIEINIIHKGVGAITEADIHLAAASDAIIIGFQVRPILAAKKLAEKEEIEVRLYSVIYDAINEVKEAMEGLLSPDEEEVIVGNAEVRDVFKITKVGTVAGCYVTDGYLKRNSKIRLIRGGIVIFGGESGGEINALKRFKDDVNEVKQSFECGISLKNYNDIKEGDVIEAFEVREIKRSL